MAHTAHKRAFGGAASHTAALALSSVVGTQPSWIPLLLLVQMGVLLGAWLARARRVERQLGERTAAPAALV